MSKDQRSNTVNAEQRRSRKLTLDLYDGLAPGILDFLRGLPPRAETAFIRALIYQWMLEHQYAEDYDQRLLEVLNGPGGRALFVIPGQTTTSQLSLGQTFRPTPRQRAQVESRPARVRRHQASVDALEPCIPPANSESHTRFISAVPSDPPTEVMAALEKPPALISSSAPTTPSRPQIISQVGFLDDLLG